MDKSWSGSEYYYCLYWVQALIRHYITTGRKYALIKKYVLNKHVRLLTRLYGMPLEFFWYVTIHGKTNHIVYKIAFEFRRPLPYTAFGLLLEKDLKSLTHVVLEILPVLKFSNKRNETSLHTLHAEVCMLTVYAKYVAPPTKSMSSLATTTLEWEQQSIFQQKRTRRQNVYKLVSTRNRRKNWLAT